VTVQHCESKSHLSLVTDPAFYQSLDQLIADGLQLTPDKFLSPQSTEADLSLQVRYVKTAVLFDV